MRLWSPKEPWNSDELPSIIVIAIEVAHKSPNTSWERTQSTHPYYHRKLPDVERSQTKSQRLHNSPMLLISTFSSSSLLGKCLLLFNFFYFYFFRFLVFFSHRAKLSAMYHEWNLVFHQQHNLGLACFVHGSFLSQKIFHYDESINPLSCSGAANLSVGGGRGTASHYSTK